MSFIPHLKKEAPIQILITDDHAIVRHGTMIVLKELLPGSIVHQADSFDQMISLLSLQHYDLLILDINMPGGNNFQMIDVIRRKQPDIKILVFSAYDEHLYATRYIQAGVNGYLHKNSSEQEMKRAIDTILSKGQYMSQAVKEQLVNNVINSGKQRHVENPIGLLSNREIEVARFLIQGSGLNDISKALNLQMTTVSTYKNRIFEKLKIGNIPELIEKFRLYDAPTN